MHFYQHQLCEYFYFILKDMLLRSYMYIKDNDPDKNESENLPLKGTYTVEGNICTIYFLKTYFMASMNHA